jgi:Carboxypeptidase regulatory-like domain
MLSKSFILSFVGLLLATFTVCAGTSVLEGVVKDPNGRPVKGADVRIEAKNFSKVVKTDANGHYVCDGLGVATYKATLVINGQVKASLANANTQAGKPAQLNFNLTGQMASAKKHTHMVFMRPDVDTHIGGGGKWVEVDDNGNIVNGTNTGASSNITTVTGTAVQDTKINMRTFGGH